MLRSATYIVLILALGLVWACEEERPVNPFDGQIVNQDTVKLEIIHADPNSIAGIYTNILHPTCANVGCHDGTFEPDYRTMESAYNTLVYQEPIKNDGNYDYRVEPFSPQNSVLMARLENLISPRMPIQLEPDSDWPEKKDQYIENIRTWIANGAPDIAGNIRQINYPAPVLLGAGATINNIWVERSGGTGPILVQQGTNMARLFFSFRHDFIPSEELSYNKIAYSENPDDFSSGWEGQLQILGTPRLERGFYGDIVAYTHYTDIEPDMDFGADQEQWYFRVYVQDDQNPVTEFPTDEGIFYLKSYMSFRWAE